MRLSLRSRVAVWLGVAVITSGVTVVLLVVVLSGRFLHDRNRPEARPPGLGPPPEELARREAADDTLRDVRAIGIAVVAGLAVVTGGVAWVVAGRIVRPVQEVTDAARSIADDHTLTRRIALDGPDDELKELGDTFDHMLDRLQATFDAQRAFVANASHELRTPLAVMRSEVDVALDDAEPAMDELRDSLRSIGVEVDRMSALIESMLWLSRAEVLASTAVCDLAESVRAALASSTADAQAADLEVVPDLHPAVVSGDPVLLDRMVANLVSNGVRYNRPGGKLVVTTRVDAGDASLVVENDGPTVDPADIPQLFERFRRAERTGDGFGIGLAIVAAVVDSHHGKVTATARPEGGLRVEARLPLTFR